jgi:hypothetical protein
VVGGIVGIAGMVMVMLLLRMGAGAALTFGKHRSDPRRMRAVAAYEGNDPKDLRSNIQSGKPWTHATYCCRRDHPEPTALANVATIQAHCFVRNNDGQAFDAPLHFHKLTSPRRKRGPLDAKLGNERGDGTGAASIGKNLMLLQLYALNPVSAERRGPVKVRSAGEPAPRSHSRKEARSQFRTPDTEFPADRSPPCPGEPGARSQKRLTRSVHPFHLLHKTDHQALDDLGV